ncbi:hypothetical protein CA984_09810 [Streptosporangium minutum]|uniref:Uncharacterized protein n=1 Tax=Streptosporangium minutum TaxID=569862 RepID=A0A243RRT7_9ACTN|nr:hypothetical protein CA984_09810 [Streptosporangium minutum]
MGTGSTLGADRTTALIDIIQEAILRAGCLVEAAVGTGAGHMSAQVLARPPLPVIKSASRP